ncbi:MAG: HEAT repeat domain-containing protein [Halobacteriovoraceae bacterium]|nr:HEAT repeat domain-containing protein [Halobacteriovoraceae bacterium]MCB9095644.1 HEAT repeat domain-containing protein [Halobacteriovoraceae bacterium]
MKMRIFYLLILILSSQSFSSDRIGQLKTNFLKETKSPAEYKKLEREVLKLANKSVPTLIEVMKSEKYPEKNRWLAIISLSRIMGQKSIPLIVKYLEHPHWMLRMAALKVMQIFRQAKLKAQIEKRLFDKSMLVRVQALETIKSLNLVSSAKSVWKMLFDEKNYIKNKKGELKSSEVLNKVIGVIGELKYNKAKKPLVKLMKKQEFSHLVPAIDQSLQKITGKESPKSVASKKAFWDKAIL